MRPTISMVGLLLAAAVLRPAPSPSQEPSREVSDGTFVSEGLPPIRIRVEEAFEYVGATSFPLRDVAFVDRYHFVAKDAAGEIQAILIFHFEGFLPEHDDSYRYGIPSPENAAGADYRFTLEPVRLGGNEYIHNTWFFSAKDNIAEDPDGELARSAQLLSEHDYTLPDELRMSRFVRVVGEDRKRELILFYLEPLAPTGFEAAEFVPEGAGAAAFDGLSAELTRRSLMAFQVVGD